MEAAMIHEGGLPKIKKLIDAFRDYANATNKVSNVRYKQTSSLFNVRVSVHH